jgi:glycosyltransferase involved in cell wall biosynthesis
MSENKLSISVFFPCYNEQENVERVVKRAKEVLEGIGADYEIIIVDDGSKDRTGEIADEMAKGDSHIRVVHHKPNRGYGGALQSGFRAATKELVFFTDGDGQFDIGEIKLLLGILEERQRTEDGGQKTEDRMQNAERKAEEKHGQDARATHKNDIVCGYRINRQDPIMRKINGWMWTRLVNFLFGMRIRDIDCAFKLFRREAVADMKMSSSGALISAEILARATRKGCRIAQAGVHHYPRTAGKQTGANIRVILRAFRELFALYRKIRRGE